MKAMKNTKMKDKNKVKKRMWKLTNFVAIFIGKGFLDDELGERLYEEWKEHVNTWMSWGVLSIELGISRCMLASLGSSEELSIECYGFIGGIIVGFFFQNRFSKNDKNENRSLKIWINLKLFF